MDTRSEAARPLVEDGEEAWQLLRDAVPFYDRDRYFAPDIEKATALILEGRLAAVLPEAFLGF